MIAEPYIAIKGVCAGEIHWFDDVYYNGEKWKNEDDWMPYADFEREKLRQISLFGCVSLGVDGYFVTAVLADGMKLHKYNSISLIGYTKNAYMDDSESSRLLKRAEFLKAVCERENVEWLPQSKLRTHGECDHPDVCAGKCHKPMQPSGAGGGGTAGGSGGGGSGGGDFPCPDCGGKKIAYSMGWGTAYRCPRCTSGNGPIAGTWPGASGCHGGDGTEGGGGGGPLCVPLLPVRDYYTKAEIDQSFRMIRKDIVEILELLRDLPDLIPTSKVGRAVLHERVANLLCTAKNK